MPQQKAVIAVDNSYSEKPDDDKVYYDEIKTPPRTKQEAFNMSVGAAYHNHGMIAEEEVEFYDLVD